MPSILTLEDAFGKLRKPSNISETFTAGILLSCFLTGLGVTFNYTWTNLDVIGWVSIALSTFITFVLIIRYWIYYYDTTNSPVSGIFKNLTPAITVTQFLLEAVIVLLVGSAIVLIFAILLVGWFAFQVWLALIGSVYALNYLRCSSTLTLLESGMYEQLVPSYKNSDATTKNRVKEIFFHWQIAIPIYSGSFYFALFLSFFDRLRFLSLVVAALIVVYYLIKFYIGTDLLIALRSKIMTTRILWRR